MGILYDDAVLIRVSEEEEEPSVITVNCWDKTGLGCDLCRVILFFGLTVVRTVNYLHVCPFGHVVEDMSTDGKWCYIVFWVLGKPSTRWSLLKNRLMEACPSCSLASVILSEEADAKPSNVFLLKFFCHDRKGLLHDVTEVLSELELIIKKVKISMTPDGKVMDLFFITDTRELLHMKKRKDDTYNHLRAVLGDSMISCEIEMVGPEIMNSSQGSSFLPDAITEDMFYVETPDEQQNSTVAFKSPSITIDNSLSPSHTLVQIVCQDHKGLLFDVMRTFKDYNIQISYGRFTKKERSECELDLFIMQDGKKIFDPSKQKSLCSRLRVELSRPLRVALMNRGPDTELLVANPVELSGKGRPLVFYDITLALKLLNKGIFLADVGRYIIGDREWEIYRVLLDEGDNVSVSKTTIEETVWRMLMSWEL